MKWEEPNHFVMNLTVHQWKVIDVIKVSLRDYFQFKYFNINFNVNIL